jgi:hypothetical protein
MAHSKFASILCRVTILVRSCCAPQILHPARPAGARRQASLRQRRLLRRNDSNNLTLNSGSPPSLRRASGPGIPHGGRFQRQSLRLMDHPVADRIRDAGLCQSRRATRRRELAAISVEPRSLRSSMTSSKSRGSASVSGASTQSSNREEIELGVFHQEPGIGSIAATDRELVSGSLGDARRRRSVSVFTGVNEDSDPTFNPLFGFRPQSDALTRSFTGLLSPGRSLLDLSATAMQLPPLAGARTLRNRAGRQFKKPWARRSESRPNAARKVDHLRV